MLNWENRPIEVGNLLNPAFNSVLIFDVVSSYKKEKGEFPYPLVFLILPILLHKATRESLPPNRKTKLHSWLTDKQHIRINFAERAKSLTSYTKEGILFGLQQKVISISKSGMLTSLQEKLQRYDWDKDSEVAKCRQKANLLGRLFADAGESIAIYARLGIQP